MSNMMDTEDRAPGADEAATGLTVVLRNSNWDRTDPVASAHPGASARGLISNLPGE